jgi:DNA polymerase (family 10)
MSLNAEIADLFASLAALMELKGENTFKVIAFQKVSRIIREMNFDLRECLQNNTLCEIEGIGKSSQQIIESSSTQGKARSLRRSRRAFRRGLVPLLSIEGLGPKTIHLLWEQRQITSLQSWRMRSRAGRSRGSRESGTRRSRRFQRDRAVQGEGGGWERRGGQARRDHGGAGAGGGAAGACAETPDVERAEIAGSLRRRKETVADVDIVGSVKNPASAEQVLAAFVKSPGIVQVLGQGGSKASVKISNGMQVDLRIVPDENFGAALVYFTGSKEHNVKIRGLRAKEEDDAQRVGAL